METYKLRTLKEIILEQLNSRAEKSKSAQIVSVKKLSSGKTKGIPQEEILKYSPDSKSKKKASVIPVEHHSLENVDPEKATNWIMSLSTTEWDVIERRISKKITGALVHAWQNVLSVAKTAVNRSMDKKFDYSQLSKSFVKVYRLAFGDNPYDVLRNDYTPPKRYDMGIRMRMYAESENENINENLI